MLSIGLGGMAGAYARYRLAGWVYDRYSAGFPWGTLAVNVTGSFLLGLMLPALDARVAHSALHAFLTVGVLGAFTTFSTFAYEVVMLVEDRQRGRAAAYVAASLGLGLFGIALGLAAGMHFT